MKVVQVFILGNQISPNTNGRLIIMTRHKIKALATTSPDTGGSKGVLYAGCPPKSRNKDIASPPSRICCDPMRAAWEFA
jgi:hypothetical protein